MTVLPNPNPMDEVHGDKMFWRQLNSRFGYWQIRNLGSYRITRVAAMAAAGTERMDR